MLKGDIINGYRITEDFKIAGGTSKVSFAEKGGEVYFIKEFLSPKYPTPDSPGSEETKERKRKDCNEFETHHKELNECIGKICGGIGGSLVYALDFFRCGTSYYKVTEKIDVSSVSCKDISNLPLENIFLIARSATKSIKILHNSGIVHGDLKPDNLLIQKGKIKDAYIAKLIDFDDSYFECKPPSDHDSLVGTPEYYSPEQAEYIIDEEDEVSGETLTCKSDIFTLGIIFCEYFTGEKPKLPEGYKNTWSAVRDAKEIGFGEKLKSNPKREEIEKLIGSMLSLAPSKRPDIGEIYSELEAIEKGKKDHPIPPITDGDERKDTGKGGTTLRGKLIKGMGEKVAETPATIIKSPRKEEKVAGGLRGLGLNIASGIKE